MIRRLDRKMGMLFICEAHQHIGEVPCHYCDANEQRQRAEAAEALLRELIDSEKHGIPGGFIAHNDERYTCTYCLKKNGIAGAPETIWHDDDCPIEKARKHLAETPKSEG